MSTIVDLTSDSYQTISSNTNVNINTTNNNMALNMPNSVVSSNKYNNNINNHDAYTNQIASVFDLKMDNSSSHINKAINSAVANSGNSNNVFNGINTCVNVGYDRMGLSAVPRQPSLSIPAAQYLYRAPAIINFVLLNAREFSAIADNGVIPSATLSTLSMVPGARFDFARKCWVFPISQHNNLQVALAHLKLGVEPIPQDTLTAASLIMKRESRYQNLEFMEKIRSKIPDCLFHSLANFQVEAVDFVLKNHGRALIADEMGLGKTRTAIACAVAYQKDWPVLVICPSSARYNWQQELNALLVPHTIKSTDIIVINNKSHALKCRKTDAPYSFTIISYNLVNTMEEKLKAMKFKVVIVDESHYMKNIKAKRTQSLLPMLTDAKRAILLSGTPALSRPFELFTQLHALNRAKWPDPVIFARRYCKGHKKGTEYRGASNAQELHIILRAELMIRRLKKDILTQLPKKIRYVVKVEIEDENKRKDLRNIREQILEREKTISTAKSWKKRRTSYQKLNYVDQEINDDNEIINQDEAYNKMIEDAAQGAKERKSLLMELFTKSGEAKLPAILGHLHNFLEDKLSGKILIFGHHRTVLDGICNFLIARGEEHVRIDGKTSPVDRQVHVNHFQTSNTCRVGVLGITAAGIAITLTAAATVFFSEVYWTPGSLVQAEDRSHRIGQTSTVKVYYFLADNTVDDIIWPLVKQKIKLLGEVVEGEEKAALEVEKDEKMSDDKQPKQTLKERGSNELSISDDLIEIVKELGKENKEKITTDEEDDEEEDNDNDDNDDKKDIVEDETFRKEPDPLALLFYEQQGISWHECNGNDPRLGQNRHLYEANELKRRKVIELVDEGDECDEGDENSSLAMANQCKAIMSMLPSDANTNTNSHTSSTNSLEALEPIRVKFQIVNNSAEVIDLS